MLPWDIKDLWFRMHRSEDPQRETFAVTFYLDESGTDGSSAQAVIAGVLLNRHGYAAFDAQWKILLESYHLGACLHMKDFGLHGRHASFSEKDREQIFSDAVRIINAAKIYSLGAALNVQSYNAHFDAELKEAFGLYGMTFLLAAVANHHLAKANNYEQDIAYIADAGNPYADHVRGAHAALQEWREALHVGTLTFGDDEKITALQSADVVAWTARRRLTGLPFNKGFDPLTGILNPAHSESSWQDEWLDELARLLDSKRSVLRAMKNARPLSI